ncbi:hypothetical protein fugu_000543 [Takifugu bimaculatus]|uniref:C2H2-type domain-containing protein n=2 Tax=Tetraodontidae TaxID=31031 RepID=A0A4Z2CHG8_9TELE|nr:hypothetical protein fugu_000543 [Takifugu bimaculatus]
MESEHGAEDKPPHTDMKQTQKPELSHSNIPPKTEEGQGDGEEEEDEEGKRVSEGNRPKRERRQNCNSATLCQVCNIQLNSRAQAQIHYRGKTHQRKLRRLAKAVSTGALSQSQVHPLLGSLSLPGRPLQSHPHSQLEHFLPLRVNSPSPLSLFPNFNKLDPVQKAVINHTFGVCPPKKKPIISCNICHLRFNSTTQAEAHYKGHKHARKLKALETQRNRQKRGRSPSKLSKDKDQDMMMLGGATASSASHLKDITGASTFSQPGHQQVEPDPWRSLANTPSSQPSSTDSSSLCTPQMSPQICPGRQISDSPSDSHPLEAGTTATSCAPCSEPQENPTGGQQEVEEAQEPKSCKKHLHCPTCKVTVNSSLQLEAHCSGSRHKQMLDGGPKGTRPQCRVKLKPSSKPACRMKQRMCSRSRVGLSVSRQPFHCEMCQVSVNSETQLKQHMNSRRHKERLAGKPVKVKLAPFNKLQPSAALVTKLALQKHLYKALPAGFLTSPLNAAAFCTVASGPMALRLPPSPTSIIQSPFISPTLFRPAPGPLRATHTPIIFSPY